jgi:transcription antitermination factor NusG
MIHWYVIRSKPQKEDFLFGQLCANNIETFYPRLHVKPVNPRARKIKPYFPGYLFVRLATDDPRLLLLQWTPGAVSLVNFGEELAFVSDGLIQAIKQRVDKANLAYDEFLGALRQGDYVLISDGAFAGYEAIFDVHLSGTERVRVLLTLLNKRQIPVELSASNLRQTKLH